MLKLWHITIICCFALLMPTVVNAQGVTTWQETTHDFGTFHESEGKKSCAFVFTNSGDSSIVVLRVQSTCGCTVANYPTRAIAPGEKDSITATFTPTGRPGPFEKDVWVYTNTSPNRTRLTIKGVVVGSPESVSRYFPVSAGALQFTTLSMAAGDVKKGLLRNSTVTAYNCSTDTIVITFDNNTSHITPHAVPDTVPPGGISTMSFFFESSRTPVWGINDDYITILGTPLHGEAPTAQACANLIANVVEDFSMLSQEDLSNAPSCTIMQDRIVFDKLAVGTIAEQTLLIKNTGSSNLIVRRVMSLDKAVTAKCDKTLLKKGEQATITVKVNPAKIDGKILNTLFTVITNDPASPRTEVRVVGEFE